MKKFLYSILFIILLWGAYVYFHANWYGSYVVGYINCSGQLVQHWETSYIHFTNEMISFKSQGKSITLSKENIIIVHE